MNSKARFLAALNGQPVDRPPIWLMRQAGRYLPEYQAVRAENPFWKVCHTPELSTKVALEPLARFKLDAAIVFSDILVVPKALGQEVDFSAAGEGPIFQSPLRTAADLKALKPELALSKLQFVLDAVSHLKAAIQDRYALIGFAGAPWTLFCYMVQGRGSDEFQFPRALIHRDPELSKSIMAMLADVVGELLVRQIEAGADVVQLFDTWGGLLTRQDYETYAAPAIRTIAKRVHAAGGRVMLFVRGSHHLLPCFEETEVDGFSLDWRISFREARAFYPDHLLQGNFDPSLLFTDELNVRQHIKQTLDEVNEINKGVSTIINLGHGIMPQTPVENVAALCDEVSKYQCA